MTTTRTSGARLEARPPVPEPPIGPVGLSEEEAERRLAERGRLPPPASSRSYASIVRANVFTVPSLILLVFGALTLAFGDWRDALFLGVLVSNTGIGIVQEVRAKRALDRLAALVAPSATVVRDGKRRRVAVGDVLEDDLVWVEAGDQIVADGVLEESESLLLDESILTGESEPLARSRGEEVRSGSFAVEGTGAYTVTAVGAASYAARLAGEARAFRHPRSPLERALNRLLLLLVATMAPLGVALGLALWIRDAGLDEAVPTSAAAVVSMVPEGLILLASLTYAVAAVRMARRGALAQQLNAIESLASVDVLCLDKTGTLTESALRVVELVPAEDVDPAELTDALGRYAASAPSRNATLAAIADACPREAEPLAGHVPFSSRRRFGALRLGETGYVLGAPELFTLGSQTDRASREAEAGRRVLAFGTTEAGVDESEFPRDVMFLGLVVLAERLRPEARATVEYFRAQGVELKILSGDNPATAAAVARDAGLALDSPPVDGRSLPEDLDELRRLVLASAVIGRISPEGKRRAVEALRDAGRYVAMVGDGVNDVPALKAARLAVAQGTGAQMAKSVADLVLVRGDFAAVPALVAEGRRILRNVQRVAKLFVTKSVFAAFLILAIGLSPLAYPLLPRHLTLAGALAIGIPAFFLALAPSAGAFRIEGFLRDVARFAVPAGVAAGVGVVGSYLFARYALDVSLTEARTVATTVLLAAGLRFIVALESGGALRRRAAVLALCLALGALYALVLALPVAREFFALAAPGASVLATAAGGAALSLLAFRLRLYR